MRLEWFVARRYLASRRGRGFLSLITLIAMGGVFVGVMALIVVTAVMTGLQRDLRDKILGSNPHAWLTIDGEDVRLDGWEEVVARVRGVDGVRAAAPFVSVEACLRNGAGYGECAMMRGIEPGAPGVPITDIVRQIRERELALGETVSGFPPILVGDALADRLGVYPGDVVTLISIQRAQLSAVGGIIPKMRKFEIAGRFRAGMYAYEDIVYTTLAAAQDLAGLGDGVTGIEITVPDPMRADAIGERITTELGGLPYVTRDWKSTNATLLQALKLEKIAMGVILFLIVVVAAFNIISTLVMVVSDKTGEIGILKSMGLREAQVQRVFMLQGIVIGLVGSLLGAVAGVLVTWLLDTYELIVIPGDVYFTDGLPVAFDWVDIGTILGLSILISFLATIYPARQAARLYPVEAIRHR